MKKYNIRCKESDEIINDNPIKEENLEKALEWCKYYDSHYSKYCTYIAEEIKK